MKIKNKGWVNYYIYLYIIYLQKKMMDCLVKKLWNLIWLVTINLSKHVLCI